MTNAIGGIDSSPSFPVESINQDGRMVTNPKGVLDNEAFMKLLVAQLRYQDPLSPTDSAALMQQTSTLSQVEMIREMTTAQYLSTASSMIGRTVTYVDSATGKEETGVVEGAGRYNGKTTIKVSGKDADLTSVIRVS